MPWPYNTNPYMPQQNQFPQNQYGSPTYNLPQQAPQMQVVRVNGRGGAEAFAIGPNSSALLLDESGRLVWAVTTDEAGYKTISPYDILPHQDATSPDYSGLEGRIKRLEEIVNEYSANTATARKHAAESNGGTD